MLNTSDVKSLSKGGTTVSLEEINNSIDNKLSFDNLIGINGIAIAKNASSDKVEVKIGDKFNVPSNVQFQSTGAYVGFYADNGEFGLKAITSSGEQTAQPFIKGEYKADNTYNFIVQSPASSSGVSITNTGITSWSASEGYTHNFLTEGNVKTINGESIYGSGDITVGGSVSLYRHNIKMNSSQHQVYFTWISSSDTALNTTAKIANEINATVSATGVVTNGGKKLWVYCVDALAVLGGVTIYAMDEVGNNMTVNGSQLTITDKVKAI